MFDCSYVLGAGKEGVIVSTLSPIKSRRDIEKFLRVDRAGEMAAQQFYKGQFAVLVKYETALKIRHMMDQELEQLETFDGLLSEKSGNPYLTR
jgi:demethoxyubiquinone hydroxylase (CLK1/Coq7/Cat5 family)